MTANDLINLMTHALGKTPDSRHSLYTTLNQAGRAFYDAANRPPWNHEWSWRLKTDITLTLPASVQEIDLPADFGSVLEIGFDTETLGEVVCVSARDLHRYRSNTNTPSLVLYVCFESGGRQPSTSDTARKTMGFWPTQDAARSDVVLTYSRAWADLSSKNPKQVPFSPPEWERLLQEMARAFAFETEFRRPAFEDELVLKEIERLVFLDCQNTPPISQVEHSATRAVRGRRAQTGRWFDEISRP